MSEIKETPNSQTKQKEEHKVPSSPRKHGFEKPFNFYQVLSWFLFAFDILFFYFLYIPLLSFAFQVDFFFVFLKKPTYKISNLLKQFIISFIFGCLAILTVHYAYKCTICDPTDSNVYSERISKARG